MLNSLLTKRLPGILVAGIVALAVGAVGVMPAATAKDASTSALTKKQKKKRAKQLKACKKKFRKNAKKRKACIKKVKKKFRKLANKPKPQPKGKTWKVMVQDPYQYSPNQLTIKSGDSILWDWKEAVGREPHDVTPLDIPAGLNRYDYKSSLMNGPNYKFKAKFTKPGNYSFICSLHVQMTMNVTVKK